MSLLDLFRKNGNPPVQQPRKYQHSSAYVPLWTRIPESVAAEYEAGASVFELCAKHGISNNPAAMRQRLVSLGVTIRPKGSRRGCGHPQSKLSPEQVQWVLEQDSLDVPHAEIARHVSVTRERIRQLCLAAQRPTRRSRMTLFLAKQEAIEVRRRDYQSFVAKLSEQWKAGATFIEMAELAGCQTITYGRGATKVAWLRSKYPDLFPYRNPNHWRVLKKQQREAA